MNPYTEDEATYIKARKKLDEQIAKITDATLKDAINRAVDNVLAAKGKLKAWDNEIFKNRVV